MWIVNKSFLALSCHMYPQHIEQRKLKGMVRERTLESEKMVT